jgi:hypothetical protein
MIIAEAQILVYSKKKKKPDKLVRKGTIPTTARGNTDSKGRATLWKKV